MNMRFRIHPLLAGVIAVCMLLVGICNASAQVQMISGMRTLTAKPVVSGIQPGSVRQGQSVDLLLRGTALRDGLQVDLGAGITSQPTHGTDRLGASTHVHVTVAANAATGRRMLILVHDGLRERQRAYLSVEAGLHIQAMPSAQMLHATTKAAVTAVVPDRLVAGHDYLLRITGTGLPKGTRFDFGAGVQAVGGATAVSDNIFAQKVHVTAGAAPGQRVVGFQLPAVQNAIAAVGGAKGSGPASVQVTAAQQQAPVRTLSMVAPVVLDSVQPARVRAGSQVQLVFTGQGLKPGLRIDYGAGFHMQPLRPLGAQRYVALVRIDANAMAGRRLPRATQPGATVQVKSPAALLVIPSPRAPRAVTQLANPDLRIPSLRVDSLYPARLDGGRSYTVQATGQGFATRMQMDLGRGITVDGVEVINDHSARVHLHVDADALAGMRFARARTDARLPWSQQPARVLVQRAFTAVNLPRPKWKAPDWPHVQIRGSIDLQTPKWYGGLASKPPPVDPVTHQPIGSGSIVKTDVEVPTLKDDVIFSWSERNPGMAEWYEVRFYRGKQLVATRKIEPVAVGGSGRKALPTVLEPDAALVSTLAAARYKGSVGVHRDSKTGAYTASGSAQVQVTQTFGNGQLPGSDLSWEVVGYRRYDANGVQTRVAQQMARKPLMLASNGSAGLGQATRRAMQGRASTAPTVVKQVEHSERWPLNAPLHPTGMACGSQVPSSLDALLLDSATGKVNKSGYSTSQSTAAHVGDRWKLVGSMNLDRSPWASSPQTMQWPYAKGQGHGYKYVATTWRFDNVFIDWGDGTVQPLALTQPHGHTYTPNAGIDLSQAVEDGKGFEHAYQAVGAYTIRVYQLSESDMQQHDAAGVSLSANPGGSLYAAALNLGGGAPDTGSHHAQGFSRGKAVADRAYMMLCKTVNIEPHHDDATDGPLHLVAAKLRGFPEDPGDASPPAGVKVAPAPDNSPLHLMQGAGAPGGGTRARRGSPAMTAQRRQTVRSLFGGKGVPAFSACDVDLTGGGYLYYYGTGKVRMTWYLDGTKVGSSTRTLAPSWPRSQAQLTSKHPAPPLVRASDLLLSPSIPLKPQGRHALSFDAEVIYDASGLTKLSGLMGQALGSGHRKPDAQLAGQLAAGMQHAPAIGVLPPAGMPVSGQGAHVAWLRAPLQMLAATQAHPVQLAYASGQIRVSYPATAQTGPASLNGVVRAAASASRMAPRKPPEWVGAAPLAYQVVPAHAGVACLFHFPVKGGGSFTISGLQDPKTGASRVKQGGGRWSGTGTLRLKLPGGDGGATDVLPVSIRFHDWQLAKDGETVEKGDLDVSDPLDSMLDMPATRVRLARVHGTAGQQVLANLQATLKNPNIRVFGSKNGPPPIKVQAVLSPEGDLTADAVAMPDLSVYDSGFTLRGVKASLDFSASEGSACGGGKGWRGLAFSAATLDAYTFQLKMGQSAAVHDWGIDDAGFCGKQTFTEYDAKVERGTIHWDGIDAQAASGTFTASYKGMRAHVPWLDVDLKADHATTLSSGAGTKGDGKIELALHGDAPRRDFGAVSLDADGLELGTLKGVGMVVSAQSTHFGFRADGKVFASDVVVPGLYFGMNGKAYFREGGGSTHVTLSGTKGMLSQGVIDLKGVDVTATPGTTQRLQFNFAGSLRISDALPAADAPVSYRMDEPQPDTYTGSGPVTGSFVIHKPFPDAHPTTNTVIRPTYVGSQSGSVASSASASPLLDFMVSPARAATQHMRYCGDVDLGMFKGPPVKGGFALGYIGSDDFWAAHADMSMGKKGMPLVPPFMTLYTIGGGLGYNVAMDSFSSGSTCDVTALVDHTPAFDAHLVVGDPTHFAYGLDGHFTVKVKGPEAGARMKYKAWMLKHKWDGGGDFWGRFQYMGGSFDGNLNGQYSFLDGKVYIEAKHDAIAMHFGHGTWYIHAGTRDNPVKGHVLIINAAAWLGVGNKGMYAGAKAHVDEGAGDCGSVCARAWANALVETKITPQPHLTSNAHMDVHAKGCAYDICLSAGVGAGMHLAALPPELAFSFKLGGCPPGHLDVGLRVLPSPKPSIGGGVCAW